MKWKSNNYYTGIFYYKKPSNLEVFLRNGGSWDDIVAAVKEYKKTL